MQVLVVINEFGGHAKGDRITDPAEMKAVLDGEHAHHVVVAEHRDATPTEE